MGARKSTTPTLNLLLPILAGMAEPFTMNDVMHASGLGENIVRAAVMNMKHRGWIESGTRSGRHGQKYWTRTRWFGKEIVRAREDEQRAALAQIGQRLAGWRPGNAASSKQASATLSQRNRSLNQRNRSLSEVEGGVRP